MTADALFAAHQSWAECSARRFMLKYGVPAFMAEAIENAALIGLWQSAQCFHPPGNFHWFAARRIWGAMQDELDAGTQPQRACELIAEGDAVTHETGLSRLMARETYEELIACKLLEVS